MDNSAIDPYREDRSIDLSIITTDEYDDTTTRTEIVEIPETSVVEYWLRPSSTTQRISVTVSIVYV